MTNKTTYKDLKESITMIPLLKDKKRNQMETLELKTITTCVKGQHRDIQLHLTSGREQQLGRVTVEVEREERSTNYLVKYCTFWPFISNINYLRTTQPHRKK